MCRWTRSRKGAAIPKDPEKLVCVISVSVYVCVGVVVADHLGHRMGTCVQSCRK